ncbi:hypothetical protein V1527DRAFT_493419 [Lipomyces starkeyi]
MEGYDTKLVGSLFAQLAFRKRYGAQLPNGSYQISASWQAGLSKGPSIGSLIGLFMNGYLSEQFGFRKTMLGALAFLAAMVFIPFFAPSIASAVGRSDTYGDYAAEVTPALTSLRESPWWKVRRNRIGEAKAALLRLTSSNRIEFDVDKAIMLMVITMENEQEAGLYF